MKCTRFGASATAVAAAVMLLAGCGGSGGGGSQAQAKGTGTLKGGGKEIVAFMPSSSNSYVGADIKAIKDEAKRLGYTAKVYENNFDQSEQDQQVQQFLASGAKPAAILWWPSNGQAGINDTRLLSRIAPIIQFNQKVLPKGKKYVKAYAGVDDAGIGKTAGEQALKARAAAEKSGMKLHSSGGNLLEFSFTSGYQAGIDRHDAFVAATKPKPFNIVHNEPTGFDAQTGFKAASQLIPKYKSKGIDFIYAQNNNMAAGIVKALEQNGLTPGKDVYVIAGDYSGDKGPLRKGKVYSAVVQSPVIEGRLAVQTAAKYIATAKVKPGVENVPASPDEPKVEAVAPTVTTYMPNPPITKATYNDVTIWGMKIDELVV